MQRTASLCLASLLCFFALSACSDNPNDLKRVPGKSDLVITPPPNETLDQAINKLLDLFPREMREHDETRRLHGELPDVHPKLAWFIIKVTYQLGLTRPALMKLAKRELVWLSDWVTRNAEKMNPPPNGESKKSAAARLVLYMSLYIYNNQRTAPPPYSPGADVVVFIVTPNAKATIVTPSGHAGVELESGSVAENTIVVITQNPTPYPANCSGPLTTRLCQYPQFYKFEQFPHTRLLHAATFSVCHITSGLNRRPLREGEDAIHDRFRLAHTKPANSADYTPGSTIPDQEGENIEILRYTTETFTYCTGNAYASVNVPGGRFGFLASVGQKLLSVVTPQSAYAIDQGGGGLSFFFSDFNDVDPDGTPDRAVQLLTVAPVCEGECSIHPGDEVIVNFNVANVGTATGGGGTGVISFVAPGIEGPVETPIGGFSFGTLVPNETTSRSIHVFIPETAEPGTYSIAVFAGIDTFPEPVGDRANNRASVPITITSFSP